MIEFSHFLTVPFQVDLIEGRSKEEKMKKFGFMLFGVALILSHNVMACSVAVNDNYQKNLLIAHGASHLDVALSSVSSTTLSGYSRHFVGEIPYSACPENLETSATISFRYSPARFQNCNATVTVTRVEFIGEVPTGPIETLSYSGLSASCSTSIPRPVIIKLPCRIGVPRC